MLKCFIICYYTYSSQSTKSERYSRHPAIVTNHLSSRKVEETVVAHICVIPLTWNGKTCKSTETGSRLMVT